MRPTGRQRDRSKIKAKPCEASARFGIVERESNVPESWADCWRPYRQAPFPRCAEEKWYQSPPRNFSRGVTQLTVLGAIMSDPRSRIGAQPLRAARRMK